MVERINIKNGDAENTYRHIARYNFAMLYSHGKDVIDATCGTGYGTWMLSQVAKSVCGFDISKDTVDLSYKLNNNQFYYGDLCKLQLPPQSCDVVVSLETIEHLDDPKFFQKQVSLALKDGGLVIYSVPLNEEIGFNKFHKRSYTYDEAVNLFFDFKDVDFYIQTELSIVPATLPLEIPEHSYLLGVKCK